jgi:uncharacterized protein
MIAIHQKIKKIVEKELSCSAHDMEHILRVYNLCLKLAENEKDIDLDILLTSALLHDIARVKEDQDNSGKTDHAELSAEMAEKILKNFNYKLEKIEKIKHCILTHRFRTGKKPETKEAKILFDADKLDVIGAIGVARSFMFGGKHNEKIYSNIQVEEYVKENIVDEKQNGRIKDLSKHTPNLEFELKLKHIPKYLYTEKAKEIANIRIKYMNDFFERLESELNLKI